MLVTALDHFNIVTDRLDETAQFYVEVLGLDRRNAPEPARPETNQWLYDGDDHAIIHLSSPGLPRPYDRSFAGKETGAIHHIALNCVDSDEIAQRLRARGIELANFELFKASGFRERFVDKGRFRDYLEAIPTRVITLDTPALVGLAGLVATL